MSLRGNVLIAQGGGPTAVINESMVGAVLEARNHPDIIEVYGAVGGIEGILKEDFLDLTQETRNNLERVARTPSSGLRSTRMKPDDDICRRIVTILKAYDIRFFFYIGGNDSSDSLRIIRDYAREENYDLRAVHIPKTVDNDLVHNDHTPGYPSAARFVAQAFTGVNLDNRALPGVYIGIIMGRHAGFLTASAALAKKYPDDGPHLIYLPEKTFSVDKFIEDVRRVYEELGRCIIAVSEGIQDEEGQPVIASLNNETEVDDHGNVQLSGSGKLGDTLAETVRDRLNIDRVRADTLGYLQRSFYGCVSETDRLEAREVGERAVQYAVHSDNGGSVSIVRTGNYSVDYVLVPLESVARKTRHMPEAFINEEGNNITDAFLSYLKPLVGFGALDIHLLRAPKVEKKILADYV